MKLDPEFKKKWLEALRSGEFKQGTSRLFNPEEKSYCCLGLAGKLAEIPEETLVNNNLVLLSHKGFSKCNLPSFFEKYDNEDIQRKLASMNDGGFTFSEIADWIEENL